jgi:hypothetical protein
LAVPYNIPTASLPTGTSLVKGPQVHAIRDRNGFDIKGHYFVFPDLVRWSPRLLPVRFVYKIGDKPMSQFNPQIVRPEGKFAIKAKLLTTFK